MKNPQRSKQGNKRKAKAHAKMMTATEQQGMMRGHTGYLTFATKF